MSSRHRRRAGSGGAAAVPVAARRRHRRRPHDAATPPSTRQPTPSGSAASSTCSAAPFDGRRRQRRARPPHGDGRDDRRRRAGRPHDVRLLGAGHRVPGDGALRRPRAPAPRPALDGAVPGPLLRARRCSSTSARRPTSRRSTSSPPTPGRAGVDVARGAARRAGAGCGRCGARPTSCSPSTPASTGDDYLQLVVDSGPRPGWPTRCGSGSPTPSRSCWPARARGAAGAATTVPTRAGRTPHELFADYLAEHDVADARVLALFDELVDEVVEAS